MARRKTRATWPSTDSRTPRELRSTTKPFVPSIWGRLHEPKKRITLDRAHGSVSPLIPIEQYVFTKTFSLHILSYYLHPCFLRSPCALLTCLKLIRSTRRTGASVSLRRTWPNHLRRFFLIFSSIKATPILVQITSFLTLSHRVLPHIQRNMHISVTLIFWA